MGHVTERWVVKRKKTREKDRKREIWGRIRFKDPVRPRGGRKEREGRKKKRKEGWEDVRSSWEE